MRSCLVLLLAFSLSVLADYRVATSFKLDVHSHVIPDIYRSALIDAGYPVTNGTLFTDGFRFPVPPWDLKTHIAAMDSLGVNYSTISISAPGVNFLANDPRAAAKLGRRLNDAMYKYTKSYPKRLGAMCILPLPHIDLALREIKVCV